MLPRALSHALRSSFRTGGASVGSSTPAMVAAARRTVSPIIVHRHHPGGSRYASTTAKGDGAEKEVIPPVEQPSTSPDKQADPLSSSSPGGTEGTDKGARATATVTDSSKADAKEKLGEADDGHTLMSEQEKEILAKLRKEFPGGTVAVQDVSGGCGTFFAIAIESDKFKGMSKIKQHQHVNKILADEVKTWHGMQLKTQAA